MKPVYRTDWQTIAANATLVVSVLVIFGRQMAPVILHNLNIWWTTLWH